MNKNVKRIFFVLTILTLLVAITTVSATNDTSDTTNVISQAHTVDQTSSKVISDEVTTTSNDNLKTENKNIENDYKNLKTATKTVDVNNYTELTNAVNDVVNDNEHDEVIINLHDGNYQLSRSQDGRWNKQASSNKNVIINANGQTLNTTYYELNINNNYNITINDATFKHTVWVYSTATFNNITLLNPVYVIGTLNLNNCIINTSIQTQGSLYIDDNTIYGTNTSLEGYGQVTSENQSKLLPYLYLYSGNNTIKNATLNKQKVNNGNLVLENCTLNCTFTNNANLTISDDCIFTENFQLQGNGITNISDINRLLPYMSTYTGNLTLENMVIDKYKTNAGNLTLINCTVKSTINNNGNLTIDDDTIFEGNVGISGNGPVYMNNSNRIYNGTTNYYGVHTLNYVSINKYIYNYGNLTINNSRVNQEIHNNYMQGSNITFINTYLNAPLYNSGLDKIIISDDTTFGPNFQYMGNNNIEIDDMNRILPYFYYYYGNITLENVTINSYKENSGNLTLKNCILNHTIYNRGNLTIDEDTIIGENARISWGNLFTNRFDEILPYCQNIELYGNNTVNNKTIEKRLTNHGDLTINNTTIDASWNILENDGTLNIFNSTINSELSNEGTLTIDDSNITESIYNSGVLIIGDNVEFGESFQISGNGEIIINDTNRIKNYLSTYVGNITFENTTFATSKTNNGNLSLTNCTINSTFYNNGNMTINDTNINSNITNNNNGTIIIDNSTINSTITNKGNITLNNLLINSTINNNGTLIINDNVVLGEDFIIYGNGEIITNNTENLIDYLGTYNDDYTLNNTNITKNKTNNGNLTIINSNITAQLTNNANITFINCSFSNNNMTVPYAKTDGFFINNKGNITLIDCIMENNTFLGVRYNNDNPTYYNCNGAILNNGNVTLINSNFNNNTAGHHDNINGNLISTGSGTIVNGGNVYVDNCNFTNNHAGNQAGALNIYSGEIKNSRFINNTATTYGGAINIRNTSVNNCTFISNKQIREYEVGGIGSVVYGGGAIASSNSNITNSLFINNTAKYIAPSLMGVLTSGGAIKLDNNNNIINCNFTNNSGDRGSAISNGVFTYTTQNCNNNTITGCIFSENYGNTQEDKSAIINIGGSSSLNLINNTFQNNYNASYVIYDEVGYSVSLSWNDYYTTHLYNEIVENNIFIDNNVNKGTLFSIEPKQITKTNNTFTNTTINDTITLDIPNNLYTGEPINITGTYTINNIQDYDSNILEQNKFEIYINGVLNQTVDTLNFTITPTAGNMILTVHPTISQTQKAQLLKSTTLSYITITPENYNTYIYEGTLLGVGKDTKITFEGTFNDKNEIVLDTNDIIIDGSNATFTNTRFILDSENITIQNMNINNNDTNYPISNYHDNNIITNNNIILKNTNGKTAAIYNQANNTIIANNTLTVEAPAGDIDFSSGAGVASSQAILLIGGNNNTIQNNNINIKATSNSAYGTLEAITNSNGATNTLITQNNINITGANFNYAIDSLNNVENITITENNINVTGERYCDGIQTGNNANNILIDNNNITCTCINTTVLESEGAITYGIIGTSMGGDITTNMTITNNNIELTGTANYGIELYHVNTTEIHNNNITVNGPFSMGIGYAYSPNGNATGNTITITGDSTTPINQITEEFKPENVGIRIQNGTENISITENTIITSDVGGQDTTIHTEPDNVTIANNQLTSSQGFGDDTIIAPRNTSIENNIIETTTTITVPETIITNTPVTLTATIKTADGTPINGGTVTFTKGNEAIAQATVTNGTATATTTFTQEGDATIVASYTPESTGLTTSSAEATTNIQKPVTQLNIEDVNITAGETVTLTAKVTDQLGNNITGGKVVFKVNGKTVKDENGKVVYAKVVDGIATVNYTAADNLAGKDVEITAVYSGYKTYESAKANTTATVNPKELTLTTTASTTQLTATLSDNTINTGKIVFKINGKTVKDANGKVIYAKVVNGTVSVDYTLPETYKAGNYTVTATFIASGYDRLVANTTMTVEN